jgi:two-component system aerobic respiration control sensor histidine kinase ArcB
MNNAFSYLIEEVIEPVFCVENGKLTAANQAARTILTINELDASKKVDYYISDPDLIKLLSASSSGHHYHHLSVNYAGITWHVISVPMQTEGSGYVLIGKLHDKSNQQLANLALQNEVKNILDRTPGKFYWKDRKSRYMGANKEWLALVGVQSVDHIIGKKDEVFFKDQADLLRANDQWVMKHKKTLIKEESVQLASGERRYYITEKMPWYDAEGNIMGIVGNSIDITERKKMIDELKQAKEKAEVFNELKKKFIHNMGHDIRTTSGRIQQVLRYLYEHIKDPLLKDTVEVGLEVCEELDKLLDDMVNFDCLQCRRSILKKPFELKQLLESVHHMNEPAAFHYQVDKKIPPTLLSDEYRIKQILLSVVGNALKFTEQGSVSVEARLVMQKKHRVWIEFIVKGTSMHIPKSKKDNIFDKCVPLHPADQGIYKGLGTGLSNVSEYVQELEGEIKPIDSQTDSTAACVIMIPMEEVSLEQKDWLTKVTPPLQVLKRTSNSQPPSASSTSALQVPQRCKILLVEDSLVAQKMTQSLLLDLDCDMDIAVSAEEALEMMETHTYDLIFADIGLPKMNGIEMTRHIRYNEKNKGNC